MHLKFMRIDFSVYLVKLNPQFMRERNIWNNFKACPTHLLLIVNPQVTGDDLFTVLFCSCCFVYGAHLNTNGSRGVIRGGDVEERCSLCDDGARSHAAALTFRQVSGSHGQMSGNNV